MSVCECENCAGNCVICNVTTEDGSGLCDKHKYAREDA
jgi:hypothetical protein